MKKHLLFLTAFSLSTFTNSFAAASACVAPQSKKALIEFEAYKTPRKLAVKGKFPEFTVTGDAPKATFKEVLESTKIKITAMPKTGDDGRDAKLAEHFFSFKKKKEMEGTIKNIMGNEKEGSFQLHLNIDGTEGYVVMNYKMENDTLEATGLMDLISFGLFNNLKALSKICFALHEGVTWPVVQLKLTINFEKAKCL